MLTRFICFGELLLRLGAPGRELLLQSPRLDVHIGGAEANVAVALAHFGHQVALVSSVADNVLGKAAIGEMRRHGVDTSAVVNAPGRMGLYFIQTGAAQRPSDVLYDRADSAFARTPPNAYDWPTLLSGAQVLHLSGVTPAIGANAAAAAVQAAHAARTAGLSVVFDGNFRSKLWQAWDGDAGAILREIFACADIVFADHRDIAIALGREFSGAAPEQIAQSAAAAAFTAFPQIKRIAATLRQQHSVDNHELSAQMFTRERAISTRSCGIAPIVDRVGTGDAFAAGVLHGLHSAMTDEDSLQFGLAACCLKHSIAGDCLPLATADVAAFLGERKFDIRR
jgi:2-dehydro-3-deoxygluconokinase